VAGRAPLLGEGTSEPPAWAPRGDEAPPAPQPLVVPPGAADAPGPLHGTRVLDLSTVFAVPYIGGLLADLGADVIKVEPTRRLDQTRTAYGPFTDNDPGERWWDRASTHQVVNRGKRSLTLDLKSDVGRGLLRELVADADVLLENFTPRVMRDWGMTYDELRELNPGLVMLSNTGYGATGPWSGFRAQGTSLEATMGIAAVTGYAEDKPSKAGQSYPDFLACWTGLLALMAALVERDASGLGQHIDLGMYQLGVVVMPEAILGFQATGEEPRRCGNADVGAFVSGLFPAAGEDRWLAVSVREDELAALASVVAVVDPSAAAADIELAVARWSRERPAGEAATLLQAAGVEAGPLLDARDLMLDPHLCARGFYETVDHGDDLGVRTVIGRPFRWHDASTSVGVRRRAPRLGEANAEIGRELGLDAARLADLHADGVMTDHPIGMRPPPRVDLQAMLATRALSGLDEDYRAVLAGRCDRG
jgi:crotonobetainyl-CoA:carnitine CoA-transferase CaiB-like acyl-CoA transferase